MKTWFARDSVWVGDHGHILYLFLHVPSPGRKVFLTITNVPQKARSSFSPRYYIHLSIEAPKMPSDFDPHDDPCWEDVDVGYDTCKYDDEYYNNSDDDRNQDDGSASPPY